MFYIVNQGEGIKTPIESLLRPRVVEAVSAVEAVHSINENRLNQSTTKLRNYKDQHQSPPRKPAIYANQIMSKSVRTQDSDQPLSEIWSIFSSQKIHHIPLLDADKKLQGIVSDRDVLRFVASNNYRDIEHYPVSEIMTKAVIAALEKTEIRTLAEVMCKQRIGAVPIVSNEMEVVGIVTRSDILRTVVHQAPLELWT